MRRVLIVSPSFPPKNAAELHRIRVSLPYYWRFDWEPTVLCVSAESCGGLDDPMLAESLPANLRVIRVRAWDEGKCRRLGFGQLAYRSLLPLYLAGNAILKKHRHDVVFFSTTVFLAFVLGPLWKQRFGPRLIYDFHDPWYRPHAGQAGQASGPGWKYRLDQKLARYLELFALKSADHIISVSSAYVNDLTERYPWLAADAFTVLPFGASTDDYAFLHRRKVPQTIFHPDASRAHWVYGGAVAASMLPVLDVFLRALQELKTSNPQLLNGLQIHFVGTDYAPAGRASKRVEPLAQKLALHGLVHERVERLPYFETLSLYEQSDALLLVGAVLPDYTSSKLFNCIMSKRPILALFHRDSLVAQIACDFPNVFLATFAQSPAEPQFKARVRDGIEWLRSPRFDSSAIDEKLKPWSAEELTRRQCAIFDRVCAPAARSSAEAPRSGARS